MQTRVDTTLHKQIMVEIERIERDTVGEYVVLSVTGTGRQYPDKVHLYKGNTLTFDIPLEVHIGW